MSPLVFAKGSGTRREGWVWETFQLLSKFAHVTPGYTDGELWASNGPVWTPLMFAQYVGEMREVLAIATMLACVADSQLHLSANLIELVASQGEEWVTSVRSGLAALGVELPTLQG
jgi:hypothetical protein